MKKNTLKDKVVKYLKGRPDKLSRRYNLFDSPKVNRAVNWFIIFAETILVLFILNGVYECPCAIRTCDLKHYYSDGVSLDWEAHNLDCRFVQEYLSNKTNPDYTATTPNINTLFDDVPKFDNKTNLTRFSASKEFAPIPEGEGGL